MLNMLTLPLIALGLYGGTTTYLHTQTDFCSDWGEFRNLVDTLDSGVEWNDLDMDALVSDPSLIECGTKQLPDYLVISGAVLLDSILDSPAGRIRAEDENTD